MEIENTAKRRPVYAILYDFDRTLSPRDMQEYQFIPSLGMTGDEFWGRANDIAVNYKMDRILAYMYLMVKLADEKKIRLTREMLKEGGERIELFPGLDTWFKRTRRCGEENGVTVEHYVLSSGLKEIIESSDIGNEFTRIFACEFFYENGCAVFPKTCVNYTSKTQFVYRINKNILDVSNDRDLNRSTPDSERRVRFRDMLYIGDGLSDVPCMKMVKAYGGSSIAVYDDTGKKGRTAEADDLLRHGRVDFLFPADYRENSPLESTVKDLIKKCAIENRLAAVHKSQTASL